MVWNNADAVCIPIPKFSDEDDDKCKTSAVSQYLLGYNFNATVVVLTRTEVHFLTAEKKRAILESLSEVKTAVKVVLHRCVFAPTCFASFVVARACCCTLYRSLNPHPVTLSSFLAATTVSRLAA